MHVDQGRVGVIEAENSKQRAIKSMGVMVRVRDCHPTYLFKTITGGEYSI
jgi:hypothetical protein